MNARKVGLILLLLGGVSGQVIWGISKHFALPKIVRLLPTIPVSAAPAVFDRPTYFMTYEYELRAPDGRQRLISEEELQYGFRGPWHRIAGMLHVLMGSRSPNVFSDAFFRYYFCEQRFFATPILEKVETFTIRFSYPDGKHSETKMSCSL